jgi:hypothetical protein
MGVFREYGKLPSEMGSLFQRKEGQMSRKAIVLALLCAVFAGAGCLVPGPGGRPVLVVPPLPYLVELGVEPYYFYEGFHYHFLNNVWYYAHERGGPWMKLPRGHYPKEVRYKHHPH